MVSIQRKWVGVLWSGCALVMAFIMPLHSYAQGECTITQITNSTGGVTRYPSLSADGSAIAFQSNRDLVGNNGDFRDEIFLYQSGVGITQITDSVGANESASANTDGSAIAFVSASDLTGSNADNNREIFLYQSGVGFTQITVSGGNGNFGPTLSTDGSAIAFHSNRNLTGSNGDGSFEIFHYQSGVDITQITNSTGGINSDASINADGSAIAFASNRNLTGNNADQNYEIFLYQSGVGITQITSSTGGRNRFPSISADGSAIAFYSTTDLTGSNADGNQEIFLYQSGVGITQITDSAGIGGSAFPSISADGSAIAFASNRDLTGSNADENLEIFLYQSGVGITQITDSTAGDNVELSISADGSAIAFQSTSDLTGSNADGNREIFLATCAAVPQPPVFPGSQDIPTLSQGGLVLLCGLLGWVLLRRSGRGKGV